MFLYISDMNYYYDIRIPVKRVVGDEPASLECIASSGQNEPYQVGIIGVRRWQPNILTTVEISLINGV